MVNPKNSFSLIYLVVSFFLITTFLRADVISTDGTINFKPNSDVTELSINTTGLGIHTNASTNLSVEGNTIISNQLAIGTSTISSNLSLSGTLGMSTEMISSNTLLGDHSVVIVDTSSDNITLTLPYTGNMVGGQYIIKKISSLNFANIVHSNGTIDNSYEIIAMGSGSGGFKPFLHLASSDNTWRILGYTDYLFFYEPTLGLERYYKLDETSGTTATDSSGNGDDGNLTGGFTFTGNTGVMGNALSFYGNPDQVTTNYGNGLDPTDTLTSLSFWAYPTSGGNNKGTIGVPLGTNQRSYVGISNNTWSIGIQDSAFGTNNDFSVTYNEWTHVALVMDGENATLYVNGEKGTSSQSVKDYTSYTLTGDISFGNAWGDYYEGMLDEIRIYSRALSDFDVLQLYREDFD